MFFRQNRSNNLPAIVKITVLPIFGNGKKKDMTTKRLRIIQVAEILVVISGLSAIIGTATVLILKEIQYLTF